MKRFLILMVLIIALFGAAKQAEAQNIECYPDPAGFDCGDWIEKEATVYPDYPYDACPLTVTYHVRYCINIDPCYQVFVQVSFDMMEWNYDDENCIEFTQALFPGYPDNFSSINNAYLNQLIMQIQEEISLNEFEEYYNNADPNLKLSLQCAMPNCTAPGPCRPFTVFFSNASCSQTCLYLSTPGGIGKAGLTLIPCKIDEGPLACCSHYRQYCYCPTTNTTVVVWESDNNQGTCTGYNPVRPCDIAPPGTTLINHPCAFRCTY